jgi:hypothetical protein
MVIVEERVDVLRSSGFDVHAFLRRKTAENHEYEQSVKKSERSAMYVGRCWLDPGLDGLWELLGVTQRVPKAASKVAGRSNVQ